MIMINGNEKKTENIEDNKIDQEDINIKKKLITLLQVQLKESEEKILKKKISNEQEIFMVSNRLKKEIEQVVKFSLENLIVKFLSIFDNIERAYDLIKNNTENKIFIEVKNILKNILDLIQKSLEIFHIKKINDINVSFDPSIHEAMSIHYANDIDSNQIVKIMQPGYILYESRLLRPAMSVVSKKSK